LSWFRALILIALPLVPDMALRCAGNLPLPDEGAPAT
jgi:hypothetical protein